MEIRELKLTNFGKFHDHVITFREGVNIIYGRNESGKTTIHSFIKAMFYGLNRSRGKAARTDEYQIRQPWENRGEFKGSMIVEYQGRLYYVERSFDKTQQGLKVYCQTTGETAPIPEKELQEMLGGMSEAAFVSSVFVPQAGCETEEAMSEELRRYMLNAEQSLDGQVDVEAALQVLRKKKKSWEARKKEAEARPDTVNQDNQNRANQIRAEIDLLRSQQNSLSAGNVPRKKTSVGKVFLGVLLFLASVLAIGTALYTEIWQLKIFLMVFGMVFLLMMFIVMFFFGPSSRDDDTVSQQDQGQYDYLKDRIAILENEYRSLQSVMPQRDSSVGRNVQADQEIAALNLAIDRIVQLSGRIHAKSGTQLAERASDILYQITEGEYHKICLDDTSEVQIYSRSRILGLHQVSGGTLQLIYLALRIASGDIMSGDQVVPIILDEAFVFYDDKRLETVLRWLNNSGRQVILFTSQRREHEIMQKIKRETGRG